MSNGSFEERIAKERLNVILLIDTSKSMQGKRITQVNDAISDIKDYLTDLQNENTNVDFYITIITYSNEARFYNNEKFVNVTKFKFDGIKCGGYSNLHFAYEKLGEILKKESQGGIMPDFGGVAPILLLLTDGHPTGNKFIEILKNIRDLPWFKASLRYGIAVELNDKRTMDVLHHFVGSNGDVIDCYNSSMLKDIIKIIVLTASKVKSSNTNIAFNPHVSQNQVLQQEIGEALSELDNLEW